MTQAKKGCGLSQSFWIMGIAKAAVLPEPVWARPIISRPSSAQGMDSSWICVGCLKLSFSQASHNCGKTPWTCKKCAGTIPSETIIPVYRSADCQLTSSENLVSSGFFFDNASMSMEGWVLISGMISNYFGNDRGKKKIVGCKAAEKKINSAFKAVCRTGFAIFLQIHHPLSGLRPWRC